MASVFDERRMLIPRPALHLARRAIPDADRSASPAGTSLRKGISSSTAARPRATDPGSPAPTRPPAPARSFSTALPRQPDCPAPAPGPGARRPCRARACDRSPRCRRRSAARPAASARPRCAGMPARHPGDAPWRDPGRRGDAPPGPAGGAWRECASRCRHACFFRFAQVRKGLVQHAVAAAGGWLSPRPGNRLARLAAARWKRRGITRAAAAAGVFPERPGFLPPPHGRRRPSNPPIIRSRAIGRWRRAPMTAGSTPAPTPAPAASPSIDRATAACRPERSRPAGSSSIMVLNASDFDNTPESSKGAGHAAPGSCPDGKGQEVRIADVADLLAHRVVQLVQRAVQSSCLDKYVLSSVRPHSSCNGSLNSVFASAPLTFVCKCRVSVVMSPSASAGLRLPQGARQLGFCIMPLPSSANASPSLCWDCPAPGRAASGPGRVSESRRVPSCWTGRGVLEHGGRLLRHLAHAAILVAGSGHQRSRLPTSAERLGLPADLAFSPRLRRPRDVPQRGQLGLYPLPETAFDARSRILRAGEVQRANIAQWRIASLVQCVG